MTKISETVIFFGSGPVAAESLRLLIKDFQIEAVVTKPRAPHHRGSVPVIELADQLNLPIFTVGSKAELDELIEGKPFKSQLGILIDFGIIVSQKVIDYFPKGIVNSHFSILPELRGADPITFAILSGQKMTGVSLMLLVEKMDEGPLIGYGEQPLTGHETTPELTDQLIQLSHALLIHEIPRYLSNETKGIPQDITGRQVSYSRKLTKADGNIDWHKPAEELEREVRAFIEWPKSRTNIGGKEVIITKAYVVPSSAAEAKPGDLTIVPEANALAVATSNGSVWIEQLKPAGKQEMSTKEFLAGYKHLLD